ncbi:hypothetical protein VTK73DRAFT_5990 [Phialemonium thermophilum]|uniref:Zn(2)-C6 fungal-type domain-containing protein n=1 Tax=Phialemonium thermophilum TaxID=223376 RepID=A0ABR3WKW1_9PEZI
MRPLSACNACRDRRKRCNRPRPGTSCTFCVRRGLVCSVEQKPSRPPNVDYEPLARTPDDGAPPISPAWLMPDKELCRELVDLYFRYIHITFHNLFHRPSFEAAVEEGSIPKILLYGVFSLAARFSCHPSFDGVPPHERGRPYAKETERLLDLHNTCLTTVQACVLLGAIQVVEMDAATESVFYTIACRLALILGLPDMPGKTRLEQEVNLRVWWTVVATDTWSSTALGLPRALQPRYDILLPMDERRFARLGSQSPDPPVSGVAAYMESEAYVSETSESILARMVMLNPILYDVNTLNARAISGALQDQDIQKSVADIAAALEAWQRQLPPVLRSTPGNHAFWAAAGFGNIFAMLHINFNYMGQLLFYRYLHHSLSSDGCRPDASLASCYAYKCKEHAARLCELIYQARKSPHADLRYPLVGHFLVIASTVHLYTLLFGSDEDEIAVAKSRLETNFQIITELQSYWPSLEASFSRLATFHKACLENKDDPFRLDQWMLRFLVEFAQLVAERDSQADDESHELRSLVMS